MKKIIRLTEQDLHRIVKESVRNIIEAHGEPDEQVVLIYDGIIEDYKANEIAYEYGISEEDAAVEWFKGVADDGEFNAASMPKFREFITDIPELDSKLYRDYGAGYYFLVKNGGVYENKKPYKTIKEDAGAGASNAAGVMQGGGTNPEAGQYTTVFSPDKETSDRHGGFSVDGKAKWNKNTGNVQRRQIYNPKSGRR